MKIRLLPILCLFLSSLANPAIPPDPSALAPGDAVIFMSLNDIHSLDRLMETLPIRQWRQDGFFSPGNLSLEDHIRKWQQSLNIPMGDFERIFPSGKILFITTLDFRPRGTAVFDLNLILEHNGDKIQVMNLIDRMFKTVPADARKSSYEFLGEKVFSVEYQLKSSVSLTSLSSSHTRNAAPQEARTAVPSELGILQETPLHFQYALVDGWLFFCEGKGDPIKKLLHQYKSSSPASLSRRSSYLAVLGHVSDKNSLMIYVNLEEIARQLTDLYKNEYKKDLSPLGLLDLKALGLSLEILPDVLRSRICIYAPPPRNGIVDIFFQFRESGFPTQGLIPPDAIYFSSFSLDFSKAYQAFMNSLEQFSKDRFGAFRRTLQSNALVMGFDIERELIGQMNGEMGYYIRPSKAASPDFSPVEVFFIPIENPELFKESLGKSFKFLKAFFNLDIGEKSHLDTSYWTITPGTVPGSEGLVRPLLGFFLFDHHLIVSSDIEELKDAIARLGKRNDPSAVPHPFVSGMMNKYPEKNRVGVMYSQAGSPRGILNYLTSVLPQVLTREPGTSDAPSKENRNKTLSRTQVTLVYQTPELLYFMTDIPLVGNKPDTQDH